MTQPDIQPTQGNPTTQKTVTFNTSKAAIEYFNANPTINENIIINIPDSITLPNITISSNFTLIFLSGNITSSDGIIISENSTLIIAGGSLSIENFVDNTEGILVNGTLKIVGGLLSIKNSGNNTTGINMYFNSNVIISGGILEINNNQINNTNTGIYIIMTSNININGGRLNIIGNGNVVNNEDMILSSGILYITATVQENGSSGLLNKGNFSATGGSIIINITAAKYRNYSSDNTGAITNNNKLTISKNCNLQIVPNINYHGIYTTSNGTTIIKGTTSYTGYIDKY